MDIYGQTIRNVQIVKAILNFNKMKWVGKLLMFYVLYLQSVMNDMQFLSGFKTYPLIVSVSCYEKAI